MPVPTRAPQRIIAEACEQDLFQHGDTFRGAGYTKSAREASERYAVMLDVVRDRDARVTLLDFGCGLAHMLDHIKRHPQYRHIDYTGLDISTAYLAAARTRHADAAFLQMDVLESDAQLPEFDYIVLNGVFNFRGPIDQADMLRYWQELLVVLYRHCRSGMAFNVMSKIVDWEREDLFHLPFDAMAQFVGRCLSRHFSIRHDYGAYEYTTYVYRTAAECVPRPGDEASSGSI